MFSTQAGQTSEACTRPKGHWPKGEDCISYGLKDVIKKIGSPIPCWGTREQYKFKDSSLQYY